MKKTLPTLSKEIKFKEIGTHHFAGDINDDNVPTSIKELSDEIKDFREKQKEFQATNDHQTYLVVVFSTESDKTSFLYNSGLESNEGTLVDGYELSRLLDIEPKNPKFKLKPPLSRLA